MLTYLGSFIVLLTPLVFVHELGHFLFAKLFGVRCDTFSIGFGPKILKFRRGETEYCVSAIPLGGYVKLYGQDPFEETDPALRERTFTAKPAWQRFLILVGGPLFNFLFAIFIFASMMVVGEPHIRSRVARVIPGTSAEVVGFKTFDLITAIDGTPVTKFEEVDAKISDSLNKTLLFRVKHPGSEAVEEVKVAVQPTDGISIYGEPVLVGEIEGLEGIGRMPVVGVSNGNSIAAKAGLQTGDVILDWNGTEIKSFEALEQLVKGSAGTAGGAVDVKVARRGIKDWESQFSAGKSKNATAADFAKFNSDLTIKLPTGQSLDQLGIYSSELFVAGLVAGAPAEKAGLEQGDQLLAVNGFKLNSFAQLRSRIQAAGSKGDRVLVSVLRQGRVIEKEIPLMKSDGQDAAGNSMKSFAIGIYPLLAHAEPEMIFQRVLNPITLIAESAGRTTELFTRTLVTIKKLIFREVSMGALGGPIMIGKIAGDSMTRGLVAFLRVMALISISLAVFNILPIPVLDGGHIFLLGIEKLRGRQLAPKHAERIQQVGMSLIMALLFVVLFNDITRVAWPAIQHVMK